MQQVMCQTPWLSHELVFPNDGRSYSSSGGGATLTVGTWVLCPPGLSVSWSLRPPDEFELDREFNVTYMVDATDDFFIWAVKEGYFSQV